MIPVYPSFSIGDKHSRIREKKKWSILIFLELEAFFYYFVFLKILNQSKDIWILSQIKKYLPIKNHQKLYLTMIFILYITGA